jgi:glutaredoxin-like protein NrdH
MIQFTMRGSGATMSVKEHMKHVAGTKKGDITLYTLSTCVWCKKVKGLLKELALDYHYVDVDLLTDADRQEAIETVKRWNPRCSYPTLVIDNDRCIVGFNEREIRGLLKNGG